MKLIYDNYTIYVITPNKNNKEKEFKSIEKMEKYCNKNNIMIDIENYYNEDLFEHLINTGNAKLLEFYIKFMFIEEIKIDDKCISCISCNAQNMEY